uniref:Uncharacterized protein n=1 Tax=Odontella aurita TaxID=265563 RepID=A0A7S4KBT0_9STRA|mmetsp:Transcript_9006/g.26905  ORF Transcript_9006/g.26905 Transcript_9006/m.26905 type:complete len:186 (+) Transcript_9006:829-1386(+)
MFSDRTIEPGGTLIGMMRCGSAAGQRSEMELNFKGGSREGVEAKFNGQHARPGIKDHVVDDFGNPLGRGASGDEMESLRRSKELMKETREILDPSSRQRHRPQKKEKMVDDFGNPLFRGATDDEVNSLRRNRELVKKAREIMDKHTREKERFDMPTGHSARKSNEGRKGSQDSDSPESDLPPFLR